MKETTITTAFDAGKLDALAFHLEKNGATVEKELQALLQKLYEKTVPANVRAFVERDSKGPEQPARRKPKPVPDLKMIREGDNKI